MERKLSWLGFRAHSQTKRKLKYSKVIADGHLTCWFEARSGHFKNYTARLPVAALNLEHQKHQKPLKIKTHIQRVLFTAEVTARGISDKEAGAKPTVH